MTSLQPRQFSPAMMPRKKPGMEAPEDYTLSQHAKRQARAKGWSHSDVLEAANNPQTTYANGRYEGQMRHIRGNLVAIVHPEAKHVVTVYENVKETDLRNDQVDADAQDYARKRVARN